MRLSLKIGEALSETFQLKCCLRWNEGQQHYSNQICLPFNAFANATLLCHCPLSANNNKLPFSAFVFFLLFLLLLMLVKIKSKRASDAHDSRTQTKYTPSKRFGKSCSKFAFVQKWANDWRHYRKAMLQLTENSLLDTFFFVTSHSPSRWIFHLYNIRFGQLFVVAHFFNLKKFTRRKKHK